MMSAHQVIISDQEKEVFQQVIKQIYSEPQTHAHFVAIKRWLNA